jgi:PTH1 family peptidyl-tRNA hydrolase
MKLVVGLGNPGREYARTRHNIGFLAVDELVGRLAGISGRTRFRALLSEGVRGTEKIVTIKPQTFMNLSGSSVREAIHWYKLDLEDVLVIVDDMDLPLGQIRLRPDGSAGGHNGLKSIFSELGTTSVPRLRVGIGRGGGSSTAHVLSRFNEDEAAELPEIVERAVDAAERWIDAGIITAMNEINVRPEPPKPAPVQPAPS